MIDIFNHQANFMTTALSSPFEIVPSPPLSIAVRAYLTWSSVKSFGSPACLNKSVRKALS